MTPDLDRGVVEVLLGLGLLRHGGDRGRSDGLVGRGDLLRPATGRMRQRMTARDDSDGGHGRDIAHFLKGRIGMPDPIVRRRGTQPRQWTSRRARRPADRPSALSPFVRPRCSCRPFEGWTTHRSRMVSFLPDRRGSRALPRGVLRTDRGSQGGPMTSLGVMLLVASATTGFDGKAHTPVRLFRHSAVADGPAPPGGPIQPGMMGGGPGGAAGRPALPQRQEPDRLLRPRRPQRHRRHEDRLADRRPQRREGLPARPLDAVPL